MPLFVVRHQHEAKACPATDPTMGGMLLKHVSKQNAASMGIDIHGEAVVDGAHTFYLILDAANDATVRQFMTPFFQAGTVDILPANPCEMVVKRAGC